LAHHKDNEALWWAFISITTTVGYGDYYPVTAIGHIIAIMMIATGVGLLHNLHQLSGNHLSSQCSS